MCDGVPVRGEKKKSGVEPRKLLPQDPRGGGVVPVHCVGGTKTKWGRGGGRGRAWFVH